MERKIAIKEEQNSQLKSYQAMLQHEVRTPLTTSILLVASMLKMALDRAAHKQASIVYGSLQLLINVVNGLLDHRSAEMGTFLPKVEVFPPADVFKLVMDIFGPETTLACIQITFTVLPLAHFERAKSPARISDVYSEVGAVMPAFLEGDRTRLT